MNSKTILATNTMGSKLFAVLAMLLGFTLAGCAGTGQKSSLMAEGPLQENVQRADKGWWAARFKINWPEGAEPSWYLDPLLADRVIAPVINQYKADLLLWRFHRRAKRDEAGHQFSFIFYCSAATAAEIYRNIQSNTILKALHSSALVLGVSYDTTDHISKPNIEDTSDRNWSPILQKSWPYFIMGVSQTWLDLIQLEVEQSGDSKSSSVGDLKATYSKVNNSIDDLWQKEGSHAFLHHLNAIFGYTPVQFYEKRIMSF